MKSRIYIRKTNRGYDWDEVPVDPPESGCEGCRKHIGYFTDSRGRRYSKCRRYYSCYSGDYHVCVPLEHTPCGFFSGVRVKRNIKSLGDGVDRLVFGGKRTSRKGGI